MKESDDSVKVKIPDERPSGLLGTLTGCLGIILTAVGADYLQKAVSKRWQESTSSWAIAKDDRFSSQVKAGYLEFIDPKKWKSNLAWFGGIAAGFTLTCAAVRAIYGLDGGMRTITVKKSDITQAQSDHNDEAKKKSWAGAEKDRTPADIEISR